MPQLRDFVPEDLWLLRTVSDPQVSPDGSQAAFVVGTPDRDTDKSATTIWVAPVDGSSQASQFSSGPLDSSPRWSPDGRWLAFVAKRDEEPQLYLAPLRGGEAISLTSAAYGVAQPAWSPDSRRLCYVARVGDWKKPDQATAVERSAPRVVTGLYYRFDSVGWLDERRSQIFVVGIEGGEPEQVTTGDYDVSDPAWSPDGKELAFVSDRSDTRFDEVHRDLWIVPFGDGSSERRLTRGRGTASSPRWSPDGTHIAYIGHEHVDGDYASNNQLLVADALGSQPPRSLSETLDRTIWGILRPPGGTHAWTEDGKAVLFIAANGGALSIYRSEFSGGNAKALVAGDRQISAFHAAAGTLAFSSQWLSEPPEAYVTTIDGSDERRLSQANAELGQVRWAKAKRTFHNAADGLEIESFVLQPPGTGGPGAPTVLEIHGGPHSWHPQLTLVGLYQSLVAAGYVVILPNPRGSQGYGGTFAAACTGDWGGGDFEDLMGAVDKLVADGIADADRLYIAGYSYGGFMSSWAIGHTDRFAAACVSAPVIDLSSIWGTSEIPNFVQFEMGSLPWERPDSYDAHSPITYVPEINAPVQLFHWEGDLRCPISQSEELFQGLRKLGREVIMVRYPGGFHVARTPSQMVDYVKRHLDWFADHA